MKKEDVLSVCKFCKGEKKNPYDWKTHQSQYTFWGYESQFPHKYESGRYSGDIKIAFQKFLDELFSYLADRYDAFDGPKVFREKYENAEADV